MENTVQSHSKVAKLAVAVLTVAMCLMALPASGQSSADRKLALRSKGTGPVLALTPGIVSTVAGNGTSGYDGDGGPAISAQLNFPMGLARDAGGSLYVADFVNNVVRKISVDGTITTVAGNGTLGYTGDGGPATSAQLAYPAAVAVDGSGNLYIGEFLNSCVRKVDTNGTISTLATGFLVRGVAVDDAGNVYYSSWYEGVWKVDSMGVVTRIAGNGTVGFSGDGGPATEAQTSAVGGLVLDQQGNLYLAEAYNGVIRKIDTNGIITTVAGDHQFGYAGDGGPATSARFNGPTDVKIDTAGNLYIVDSSNNRIRKVNASGTISTIAGDGNFAYSGDGGLASHAQFGGPVGVAVDETGNVFISDSGNNVIRKVRVDSTALDFGSVTLGQTGGPLSVIVSNVGSADLKITNVVASSGFEAQTTCPLDTGLSTGADCFVEVSFTPTAGGNLLGTVTIINDAVGNPHVINLQGQGYIAPPASELVLLGQFFIIPLNGNLGVVTVDAMDADNHLVPDFNGTVTLQLQGPAGFKPFSGQSDASGGIVTFDLTAVILNVVGDYTITVSSPGLSPMQVIFTVAGNPDFSVTMTAKSLKVTTEGAATINAAVAPVNGFFGSVALSCSGLPSHSKCSFAPALLQADGSDTVLASAVTISTGVSTDVVVPRSDLLATTTGILGAGLLGLVFGPVGGRNTGRRSAGGRRLALIFAAIILCVGLVGCGHISDNSGSHSTPAGTYSIRVTGTSNGISHNSTFSLVVQ